MGNAFETICQQFVRLHGQEVLGLPVRELGRIWAGDYDLDLAGSLLDGSSLYGECKWWIDLVGEKVLERLLETSNQTKYGTRDECTQYLLFSRSGFSTALKPRMKKQTNLHLIGLDALFEKPIRKNRGKRRDRN
jgi:uncharacterized protein